MAPAPTEYYTFTVNYDLTIEEMVATGKYNWSHPEIISTNFCPAKKGTAEVRIELIHFDRYIESDEALAELDRMGLCPANLPELLAFGAQFPDKQSEFSNWQASRTETRKLC
jgi:hypothetical protein